MPSMASSMRLSPLLDPGDILIDAGNSLFSDTDRRVGVAAAKSLRGRGAGRHATKDDLRADSATSTPFRK